MAATAKITVLVDLQGRILAAQLPELGTAESKEKPPEVRMVPLTGQRMLHIEVPREISRLPGPELHRYFTDVKISCSGEVSLPKIKVLKVRYE